MVCSALLPLGWEVPAPAGILHLLAFCLCKMVIFSHQWCQTGAVGVCLFPGRGTVICQGFCCFPWWDLA